MWFLFATTHHSPCLGLFKSSFGYVLHGCGLFAIATHHHLHPSPLGPFFCPTLHGGGLFIGIVHHCLHPNPFGPLHVLFLVVLFFSLL